MLLCTLYIYCAAMIYKLPRSPMQWRIMGGDWGDVPPWKTEGTSHPGKLRELPLPPPGWKSVGLSPLWKNFNSIIFFLSIHKRAEFEIIPNPNFRRTPRKSLLEIFISRRCSPALQFVYAIELDCINTQLDISWWRDRVCVHFTANILEPIIWKVYTRTHVHCA